MSQILGQEQASRLSTHGVTPNNITSLKNSKQHNEYSINGTPSLVNKPLPSKLDLDGKKPSEYIKIPHL